MNLLVMISTQCLEFLELTMLICCFCRKITQVDDDYDVSQLPLAGVARDEQLCPSPAQPAGCGSSPFAMSSPAATPWEFSVSGRGSGVLTESKWYRVERTHFWHIYKRLVSSWQSFFLGCWLPTMCNIIYSSFRFVAKALFRQLNI